VFLSVNLCTTRLQCPCCRYENSHEQLPEAKLERLFLYCLCWSLGGLLTEKQRPAFDSELRSIGGNNLPPKCVLGTLLPCGLKREQYAALALSHILLCRPGWWASLLLKLQSGHTSCFKVLETGDPCTAASQSGVPGCQFATQGVRDRHHL
jgi:hypothetical protein